MSLARGLLGLSLPQALKVLSIYYVILGRRNLFKMGAVRSARDSRSACSVGLAGRNFGNGRVVLCTWETIIASSGLQLLWEGYVFFWFFVCVLYNIITIQYNLIL